MATKIDLRILEYIPHTRGGEPKVNPRKAEKFMRYWTTGNALGKGQKVIPAKPQPKKR